jgi:hypothetical protein
MENGRAVMKKEGETGSDGQVYDEQVFNIELKPRSTADGKQVGMNVRLVVRDGDIISIKGRSTGDRTDEFVGKLILSLRDRGTTKRPRTG